MATLKDADVEALEARLLNAMRRSSLNELDALLADDLIFTDHLGALWRKQDDLAAHRDGVVRVESVVASDLRIRCRENVAVACVQLQIVGVFGGVPSSGTLRFTRVWAPTSPDRWQVIAAHSTIVTSS